MTIPDEPTCVALMSKYQTPHHIVRHCFMVWTVAQVIGSAMTQRNHPMDMELLKAACLLHDIGKYPCILEGNRYHDRKGKEMLEEEGYPEVASIVGRHVNLAETDGEPLGEAHVLFYADKRVNHDELVSLEQRFDYLFKTYAKTPYATERLNEMKRDTRRLEERIFLLLDFEPDCLASLI
ncbi:MAG: HD domain-containing protein [Thermodesulfobacteriota bacterium]